jgi:NAD(P)-dependent dehydrogenase (short-subunit alcohol dehydrogenase family)
MTQANGGQIINLASMNGVNAFPRRLAYGVSKAGVVMMTKILASEWAPEIRVNAIAPGIVSTELTQQFIADGAVDAAAFINRTPLKRMARPEEIAAAALFLASEDAAFITGHILLVDGGWSAYGYI